MCNLCNDSKFTLMYKQVTGLVVLAHHIGVTYLHWTGLLLSHTCLYVRSNLAVFKFEVSVYFTKRLLQNITLATLDGYSEVENQVSPG